MGLLETVIGSFVLAVFAVALEHAQQAVSMEPDNPNYQSMLQQLNSPFLYLVCGLIILFVAAVCVIFLVRAYRAGKAIGMDEKKLKRAVTSSMTFSVLPSIGILLGVIALSGSLGTPWPWLRLSVIGALHYETQVAQAATIALLMSICIMWGMVLTLFFNKSYLKRLGSGTEKPGRSGKKRGAAGFADTAMSAMFIGLISAYLGSYIGAFVSGNGSFTFSGDPTPIIVAVVSCAVMAVLTTIAEKKNKKWIESFSIALSMLIGMLAAIV